MPGVAILVLRTPFQWKRKTKITIVAKIDLKLLKSYINHVLSSLIVFLTTLGEVYVGGYEYLQDGDTVAQ